MRSNPGAFIENVVELFNAYIPWDRALAIQRSELLPDRTQGAALYADISGFTPLTKALASTLGPRRGVEELTIHLNRVYGALVTDVHRFGGSVIGFAGDAITCWFDGDDGVRATACGLAMQRSMSQFARVTVVDGSEITLALKVSMAIGPARRFLVGDEEIQLIDVLAGETLSRMAAAGGIAGRGDVVLDDRTAKSLEGAVEFSEWRYDQDTKASYAFVRCLRRELAELERPAQPTLTAEQVRPWLLSPVFNRLVSGQGEFLTELRPAVPIFLKFSGIDYDHDDEAGKKLDAFVQWVQRLLTSYGGFLLDVTLGDKGSYMYCIFGAPVAHENEVWRALTVAAQLRRPPPDLAFISRVQIGICRGMMRTGAYGGTERRTYGVLGSEVNMAARLMEKAKPGQVMASGRVRQDSGSAFTWEDMAPILVKGNADPLPVAVLLEPAKAFVGQPGGAPDALPLVGRKNELAQIDQWLARSAAGRGQAMVLVAEAGLGKSRLAAEAVRRATDQQFVWLGGQCVSHGVKTSYLAWWPVWTAFFHLNADLPAAERIRVVERQLAEVDKGLANRLPLLGPVLNLHIPDNDVTAQFDAKLRKASLEALLADCVRHRAATQRLLFVLEDAHWMDPLSKDLLEMLGRAAQRLPVGLLVTQRPPDASLAEGLVLKDLPNSTIVRLEHLSNDEAAQLLKAKLARMFGPDVTPSPALLDLLIRRSEGNPFFLEELLNFLKDQGVSPDDPKAATSLDLPSSLQSLILSRIDQLSESQKTTMKLASVVGRTFSLHTLLGVNPSFREKQVAEDLDSLGKLELTPIQSYEPEPTYMFKHGVTQEVAYQSLPFGTRAKLHNDIGLYLETGGQDAKTEQLDLLAYHFDRSENRDKKRHYLLKAGESAQSRYANSAAIDYYQKLLPLLKVEEKVPVLVQLGQVLELVGKWREARDTYESALRDALELKDPRLEARCRSAIGELRRKEGEYVDALQWLEGAQKLHELVGDEAGQADVLHLSGTVNAQRGEFDRATALYERSMAIRRQQGDKRKIASLLSNLGIIAWYREDLNTARRLYEESLAIRREIGDRWSIANSLNNLALLLSDHGEFATARGFLEECLAINRELGDRWAISNSLSSLADVALDQGDFTAARAFLVEGTAISRELGDRVAIAFILEQFVQLAIGEGKSRPAYMLAGAAALLRENLKSAGPPNQQVRLKKWLAKLADRVSRTEQAEATEEGRIMGPDRALAIALGDASPGESPAGV